MSIEKLSVVTIRMTPALRDHIRRAADTSGLGFTDWIRAVLARAANEGAYAPKEGGTRHVRTKGRR